MIVVNTVNPVLFCYDYKVLRPALDSDKWPHGTNKEVDNWLDNNIKDIAMLHLAKIQPVPANVCA